VLWVNDPSAATLVALSGWPALYDITDDWLAADRTADEHRRLVADEALLLECCAEVTVCSKHLAASKHATREVTLISNGVDLDRYRAIRSRPTDLPSGSTAVYVGTVHPDRFDVPILRATARALGAAGSVVLVGPVVDLTRDAYRAMVDDGVVVLGPRPWHAVPAYLQHADVLLVPHLVNEFTDSLDPIKVYEYRAVGRPVVATPVAGFRDGSDPRVTVAQADDFPSAVARVLKSISGRPGAGPDEHQHDVTGIPIPTWHDQAALMSRVIDRVREHATTPR
jgi:glycosyltransferase involved in cell wall biosynthesis